VKADSGDECKRTCSTTSVTQVCHTFFRIGMMEVLWLDIHRTFQKKGYIWCLHKHFWTKHKELEHICNCAVLSQWIFAFKFFAVWMRKWSEQFGSQQGVGGGSHPDHTTTANKNHRPCFTRWWQLKNFLVSPRTLAKWSNLTIYHIFQGGWFNHQPVYFRYMVFSSPTCEAAWDNVHVKVLLPVAQPVSGTVS